MIKPINLLMSIPQPDDPTSWYRGTVPFVALQKEMPQLNFTMPPIGTFGMIKFADIAFFQRPAGQEQFQAINLCKDMGKKVWIDFDDDNLACPDDNDAYPAYSNWQVKEAIVKASRIADVITVSTEKLKKRYRIYDQSPGKNKIIVVPNAIDDDLLRHRIIPDKPREKSLMWRGSRSHKYNLETIRDEIIYLANTHKDWTFSFFGDNPVLITSRFSNKKFIQWGDVLSYHRAMCGLHTTAVYYPLANNDHAQSRSHVSWLEATFGGAQFVGFRNEELTRPGALNFGTPKEFVDHMEAIIRGEVDIDKNVNEAWACIRDKYLLSKTNQIRRSIVEMLANS